MAVTVWRRHRPTGTCLPHPLSFLFPFPNGVEATPNHHTRTNRGDETVSAVLLPTTLHTTGGFLFVFWCCRGGPSFSACLVGWLDSARRRLRRRRSGRRTWPRPESSTPASSGSWSSDEKSSRRKSEKAGSATCDATQPEQAEDVGFTATATAAAV